MAEFKKKGAAWIVSTETHCDNEDVVNIDLFTSKEAAEKWKGIIINEIDAKHPIFAGFKKNLKDFYLDDDDPREFFIKSPIGEYIDIQIYKKEICGLE